MFVFLNNARLDYLNLILMVKVFGNKLEEELNNCDRLIFVF